MQRIGYLPLCYGQVAFWERSNILFIVFLLAFLHPVRSNTQSHHYTMVQRSKNVLIPDSKIFKTRGDTVHALITKRDGLD